MRRFLFGLALVLSACTDADYAQWSSIGEPANIVCYSGGKEVYRGRSSGKLHTEQRSDGWYFQERPSGYLIRVSADCVITQQTGSSPKLAWPTAPDAGHNP